MEGNGINLTASKLNLPLFMVSRLQLVKSTKIEKLRSYIKNNKHLYINDLKDECHKENNICAQRESREESKMAVSRSNINCGVIKKSIGRSFSNDRSWLLPPNIYDISKQPFENYSGLGGAYWHKLNKTKARVVSSKKPKYQFYDLPRETEKMDTKCHRHKSRFLSNCRERRATTRCMISNPLTCYKDPNFPGPNSYHIGIPSKKYKKLYVHNAYEFYRNSVVPLKKISIHPSNKSFLPGPGRYEIRYQNFCPCSGKLLHYQNLQLLIDSEKRKKFRRLPYEKIKSHLYCSPDLRHIKGDGHKHVFKGAKPYQMTVLASSETRGHIDRKMYPDSKYISMINNTPSKIGSIRKEPMTKLPTRIVYNSMVKVITRKQLRSNKKIAFSSGLERWKDSERPMAITARQLKELKEKLPLDRQLSDQPVMSKNISEIMPKLQEIPKHMKLGYKPRLRKYLFKFLPIPQAKVLVTAADTRSTMAEKQGYYLQTLEGKDYFK